MDKYCNSCMQTLSVSMFAFRNKQKQTYQPYCNDCRRLKSKTHYLANKKSIIERSVRNSQKKHSWFRDIKKKLSCYVCGENDYVCLDFHHIDPSTKLFAVSEDVRNYSKRAILEEISKCACLCANCHRKHHANRLEVPLVKLDITQVYEI